MENETTVGPCTTGEECPKAGTWFCSDHPAVAKYFHKGEIFPNCWHVAGHRATWIYER